jgi:ATP-dependent Clp protease adaptor protein ClpS
VTSPTTERAAAPETADEVDAERPWVTIVWNDPVNLMTYVTYILQKLFGYSIEKATHLMLQVHNEGKAVVSAGTREEMERDCGRLHAAGLWATLAKD